METKGISSEFTQKITRERVLVLGDFYKSLSAFSLSLYQVIFKKPVDMWRESVCAVRRAPVLAEHYRDAEPRAAPGAQQKPAVARATQSPLKATTAIRSSTSGGSRRRRVSFITINYETRP